MEHKKERIEYFDLCKGLLIILVVLGHVMSEDALLHRWIYSWHMPAFFMINGMLLSYTKYSDRPIFNKSSILCSGIKRLIVPYFVYAALLLIARWINSGFDLNNLRWQIIDCISLSGIGATWFLPCLFFRSLYITQLKKSAC